MEPNHKELLIGLIGSTYGELKRLDDSIIGSSSTLGRRSDQVKQEMMNVVRGISSKQDVPVLQAIQQASQSPQGIPTNPPIAPEIPPMQTVAPQPPQGYVKLPFIEPAACKVDDNQLEFNLDKVAKYDDVIAEIDRLDRKLTRIEDKVDQIVKNLEIPKKKARGLNSS